MTAYDTQTEETLALGREMAAACGAGAVIALVGDLGVGKTVFAKGFADGLGIMEPVTSPTFTIVCEYREGRLPLYHFDVYRLEDVEELFEIGWEEYLYGDGVCLIEWADRIAEELPEETVVVMIEKKPDTGDDARRIMICKKDEWLNRKTMKLA